MIFKKSHTFLLVAAVFVFILSGSSVCQATSTQNLSLLINEAYSYDNGHENQYIGVPSTDYGFGLGEYDNFLELTYDESLLTGVGTEYLTAFTMTIEIGSLTLHETDDASYPFCPEATFMNSGLSDVSFLAEWNEGDTDYGLMLFGNDFSFYQINQTTEEGLTLYGNYSSVPEPASIFLIGSGILCLAGFRRYSVRR